MTFVERAFSFRGRMRRRDYWLGNILLVIAFLGVGVVIGVGLVMAQFESGNFPTNNETFVRLATIVVTVLIFWPTTALAVKRGHDRGRPAILFICLQVATSVLGLVPLFEKALEPLVNVVQMIVTIYVFIDLGLLDGDKGENRYGPSPKAPDTSAEVFA
jgi:uncharacterized membrane protein YhaH (DUF805 family)